MLVLGLIAVRMDVINLKHTNRRNNVVPCFSLQSFCSQFQLYISGEVLLNLLFNEHAYVSLKIGKIHSWQIKIGKKLNDHTQVILIET